MKRMHKRILSFVLSVILILTQVQYVTFAAGGPDGSIGLSATKTTLGVGETTEITVSVNATGDPLGAINFTVDIPDGLEYVSHEIKVAMSDFMMSSYNSTTGEFGCGVTMLGKAGEFDVLSLTLQAKNTNVGINEIGIIVGNMFKVDGSTPMDFGNVDSVAITTQLPTVAVTGVTIDETASVNINGTVTPSWTVNPNEATNKKVTFTSNNESVATVNETTGEVEGISKGTATITVKTEDGNFTDTCVVTVNCAHTNKTNHAAGTSTCKVQANDQYYTCDTCAQIFAADQTTELNAIPMLPLSGNHTYTKEDPKAEALASVANCKSAATYYYSCSVCDTVENNANHTFTNGNKDANNHVGGTQVINASQANHKTQQNGYTGDTQCLGCQAITEYGQPIPAGDHHESSTWTTNDTQHWKVCDVNNCGVVIDGTTGSHTSTGANQATCQAKAVCDTCGVSYGSLGSHDMATGNDWSKDATGHWYKCKTSGCDETSGFAAHNPDHQGGATEEYPILCTECGYEIEAQLGHTHVYDKTVATDDYLATKATCKDQATYYKSCKCGLAGTETFASGALADHKWDPATCTEPKTCSVCHLTDGTANGHTEGTEWKRDDNNHWHICKKCDAVIDASVEAHNPDHQGGATEEYPILCTECGYEMEAQLNHTHVYDKEVVAEKYLVSEATCQKYAVYKLSCKCGAAGTETFEDVNAGYADHKWNSAWTKDETGHWHECKTDGCEEVNEYAVHTPGEDWKRDKNNHWHICEECNAVIADSKEAHTDADSNKVCDVCDYQMKAEKSESSGRVEKYGWLETDGNWYYHLGTKKAKGWYEVKNYWYYFKKNYPNAGAMQTGWIFDEGRWYYLGENGVMKTGWRLLGGKWYYLGQSGAMKTGWFFDPNYNAWYYLHDENGDMLVNTTTPDGYYVGADGKWVQ